jgi:hypothetical protein
MQCYNVALRMRTRIAMRKGCPTIAALAVALVLAGCAGGFGGSKRQQPDVVVNADLYPANYRVQIATMLRSLLTERSDYNALISPPMLKPVPDSPNPHYVVCLQFNRPDGPKTKVVIYLGGDPQQYVDATPEECDGAPYQSFTELAAEVPRANK